MDSYWSTVWMVVKFLLAVLAVVIPTSGLIVVAVFAGVVWLSIVAGAAACIWWVLSVSLLIRSLLKCHLI